MRSTPVGPAASAVATPWKCRDSSGGSSTAALAIEGNLDERAVFDRERRRRGGE
jgi:hypothetical protein